MRLPLRETLRVLLFGALAALSLPGVHAARAEADLLPPAKQLFSWNSAHPIARPSRSPTCGANPGALMQRADIRRQAAMARIAQLMAAGPGDGEQLNGRGNAYPVRRDPNVELMRIQQEAQRLQAARAASR